MKSFAPERTPEGGYQYKQEDMLMRNIYLSSNGSLETPDSIVDATDCRYDRAWRLWVVCEGANARLLFRWSMGEFSWRLLWRVVTDYPNDPDNQLKSLAEHLKKRR